METIEIQLPDTLVQQLQKEVSLEESLSQVVAESLQMWFKKRRKEKAEKAKALQTLRQAAMVMDSDRQRAMAQFMIKPLSCKGGPPTYAQVEAPLAKVKAPLSEKIITMRKER